MPTLKLPDVESSLMDEFKKKHGKGYKILEDEALFSNAKKFYNNKSKDNKGFTKINNKACGFCGKSNHKEEDCYYHKRAQKAYLASINPETESEDPENEDEVANLASQEAANLVIEDDWSF